MSTATSFSPVLDAITNRARRLKILMISLYPLNETGGGERFTYETMRSIVASGDICDAYALTSSLGDHRHALSERLGASFSMVMDRNEFLQRRTARTLQAVLDDMYGYDVVWIEQFLSNDTCFDIIASVASNQTLLFTSHGHEVIREDFQAFYQPAGSHSFVEVSEFSARRSAGFSHRTFGVGSGVWRSELTDISTRDFTFRGKLVGVGRVLPHKGFEHTIAGLPPDCELRIVGPYAPEAPYTAYLREASAGRRVDLLGEVSNDKRNALVRDSDLMIASSCHRLYDGTVIDQAELLGIVLFEALAQGTLPLTSNIPPFLEGMSRLGLGDLVYKEGDAADLRRCVESFRSWRPEEIRGRVQAARHALETYYLWDDFWIRVKAAIKLRSAAVESATAVASMR
ncbi:MAG TPA: glycosyltransferase family 4 protein [Bryobacteraceae bacterium]|nr:glycosyltransferase family 4 protein [Bryobacteraceae bacterium]